MEVEGVATCEDESVVKCHDALSNVSTANNSLCWHRKYVNSLTCFAEGNLQRQYEKE